MKYVMLLGSVVFLSGCTVAQPHAFCPAMHGWDKAFQHAMAGEVLAHWQDCPALLQAAMQLVELHRACGVQ
ncbi:hypothetical protein [Neokomagataea thailandica]|uniref:Lipoprotein n=1 Tax=Neokomagataea tanensis NBRC 106556 TaxID=1223519 RepID=A0ABQ0QH31_9PROT|nr:MULTISPECIES: hypothetical protein [Neokomagataea]GBR44601.1 hypothetical protein AA106556_0480 [Neokomagataea tanensis NBRC 106556]